MLGRYDPGEILMTVGGTPIVGYGTGTFVTAERNEDAYSFTPGASGDGVRVRNRNRSGRVTFTLLQTSPSNDVLAELALLSEKSNTLGVVPIQISDNLGRTKAHATNAWVVKVPAAEFSKEQTDREWILETDHLMLNVGGA